MWAFLVLVAYLLVALFVQNIFIPSQPAIPQSLILSPDSRTLYLNSTETTVANFTVIDLNAASNVSATVTLTLTYFSNSTRVPANGNVTLSVKGVYTGASFAASGSGNNVVLQFGGNTLAINIKTQSAKSGLYTLTVALTQS